MGVWKWGLQKNKWLWLIIALGVLATSLCQAWMEPFEGFSYQAHHIRAADNARLVVVEIKGNDDGEVVVLHPGYVETAATFHGMVDFFLKQGRKVYVAQSRFVGQGNLRSGGNRHGPNGLAQVLVTDTHAVWDFVISQHPSRKFHVVGHSMGGGQILAGTADPERGQWFENHIASRALITPLHNMKGMSPLIKWVARLLKPILELALKYNIYYIAPHHTFYSAAKSMSQHKHPFARYLAGFVEDKVSRLLTMVFNGLLIDGEYTSMLEFREVVFTASGFSVDLCLGWVNAVLEEKLPVPMLSDDSTVPTLVAAAEKDRLLILSELKKFMDKLISLPQIVYSKWILMEGAHHVDPVSSKLLMGQLLTLIRDFQDNPAASTQLGPKNIRPRCEDALFSNVTLAGAHR